MIEFSMKGSFNKTFAFLKRNRKLDIRDFDKFGRMGVEALKEATPKDSGLTADSWYYEITNDDGRLVIQWLNSNVVNGWCNVAVILQYGHATGTGGYVEGIDYINPALAPIFDKIAKHAWEEVTRT